ncbi:hypothetical protein HK101_004975 [Irineochytrium annulatum]|nr:hypothetical protein HK101_004975 [Irineochytrium annulatum]
MAPIPIPPVPGSATAPPAPTPCRHHKYDDKIWLDLFDISRLGNRTLVAQATLVCGCGHLTQLAVRWAEEENRKAGGHEVVSVDEVAHLCQGMRNIANGITEDDRTAAMEETYQAFKASVGDDLASFALKNIKASVSTVRAQQARRLAVFRSSAVSDEHSEYEYHRVERRWEQLVGAALAEICVMVNAAHDVEVRWRRSVDSGRADGTPPVA